MITINANLREPIFLRHAGEENALRVAFDLQEFEAHWPGGVPALLVRRPISSMDTAAYPVPLSVDGGTAFWTVSASDTECSGYGKAQLQWRVGGTLAKSCVYDTVCAPSLIAGDAPPDAPSKAWFEAIQAQIGDLSELKTAEKSSLVGAINEAAEQELPDISAETNDMALFNNGEKAEWREIPSSDSIGAIEALSESGILTPAYQDGTFYMSPTGEVYVV